MPTMEIVSFEAKSLELKQEHYDFKIEEENKLESHRNLFKDYLNENKGVIVHLGNRDQIGDTFCWASDLINWDLFPDNRIIIPKVNDPKHGSDQSKYFRFIEVYRGKINELMNIALKYSPIGKAAFLTSYQFGPEKENVENIVSIENFWKRHDEESLIFNTLYEYIKI
jgi:hypothetical protein